jgi:hypothetical protein
MLAVSNVDYSSYWHDVWIVLVRKSILVWMCCSDRNVFDVRHQERLYYLMLDSVRDEATTTCVV